MLFPRFLARVRAMNVPDAADEAELSRLNIQSWIRCLSLHFLVGASVALAVWAWSHPDLLEPYVRHNRLPADERLSLLRLMGVGAIGFTTGALVLAHKFGLASAERAAKRIAPLLVSGLLPFALSYRLWVGHDIVFLFLVLLCSLGAGGLARPALEEGLYRPFRPRLPFELPRHFWLAIVLSMSVGYAFYFSVSTINNHQNFGTSAFDLGIETNLIYNTLHGGPLFRSAPLGGNMEHGGFHQTYFAFLIAPIYGIWPRAETLLVIQSTFLGASATPLFLFARRKLGEPISAALSALLLLYAPLHGSNLYDFHYQPFGVFFIFLLAFLIDSGRSWKVILPVALVTLSVREDMGAMMGALGGYFLMTGRRPLTSLWVTLLGSAYVVSMKMFIMPEFFHGGRSSFTNIYRLLLPEGEQGFGAVLKTVVGNPAFTLDHILVEEKLVYVAQLFVPVALYPLRRSMTLLLFVPGFVFALLSTAYPALIMTSFQYTAYWTPMIFLSIVIGLAGLGATGKPAHLAKRFAWLIAIFVGVLLSSVRYGAVFQVELARGAFDPVHLRETEEGRKNMADFEALAQQIPSTAKVAASEWLIAHLANRPDAYAIRNGVLDAEYILFWLHPDKFRGDERPVLLDAVVTSNRYGVIERRGMFVLAKKGHPQEATVARELRRELMTAGTPRARRPLQKVTPPRNRTQ